MIANGELSAERGREFQQLLIDVCAKVMCHPIVASNQYLRRFREGVTEAQARHECQQFSVFAINFDVAQAKLVANAPTKEAYEEPPADSCRRKSPLFPMSQPPVAACPTA